MVFLMFLKFNQVQSQAPRFCNSRGSYYKQLFGSEVMFGQHEYL